MSVQSLIEQRKEIQTDISTLKAEKEQIRANNEALLVELAELYRENIEQSASFWQMVGEIFPEPEENKRITEQLWRYIRVS